MSRSDNVRIFAESKRLWETDPALMEAVEHSRSRTALVPERKALANREGERIFREPVRVRVSQKRSFEAAAHYRGQGACVLNFASSTNPGGGVVTGASAQEESLCRCSTLFPCLNTRELWDGFYQPHRDAHDPLHNDDCVYTPDIVVFRDDGTMQLLPEDRRFRVDVLTCAAPNLRNNPSNGYNPGDGQAGPDISREELRRLLEKRVRRILNLAAEKGARVLILGAFGCGAFRNPPEVVAGAMRRTLEDYRLCFETVEFAVFCPPGHEENYRAFRNAFLGWN